MERRYLIVPGISSSRIHILNTKIGSQATQDRQGHRAEEVRSVRDTRPRTPCIADLKVFM